VRPTVSVIVPFAGTQEELEAVVARLGALPVREGDELVVADNRRSPRPPASPGPVRWVDASGPAAPGHARNVGAAATEGEWLVFLDADVAPEPGLLDAYFDPPPAAGTGILGGHVRDVPGRPTLVSGYVVARRMMDQGTTLAHPHRPFLQMANCAVRRAAFDAVGGFDGAARAGEDADLCWRLSDSGWGMERREEARAAHRSRDSLRALLGQLAVHGAGAAWLDRRHPGSNPRPSARKLLGRLRYYPREAWRAARRGERPEAAYVVIDLLALYAFDAGRLRGNERR
jgi:GT2 family glycosyltransferase